MPAFATFGFEATGAPATSAARRTMPDRLNDVTNVKDWGAVGDNSADDRPAIQAAIDNLIDVKGGGTLFVPEGVYRIPSPGLVAGHNSNPNIGIKISGCGKHGSSFTNSSFYGGFLSKGGKTYDCIEKIENMDVMNVVLTRNNVQVIGCNIYGIDASGAIGAYIAGCGGASGAKINARDTTQGGGYTPGSYCVAIGSGGTIVCWRGNGVGDICFMLSGDCPALLNSSCEVGNEAVRVGWAPGVGEVATRGAMIMNIQTEQCNTGINLYNLESGFISGNVVTGTVGTPELDNISAASWSSANGGEITHTTQFAHNLPVGTTCIQIRLINGGNNEDLNWDGDGIVNVTRVNATQYKFPSSNPGTTYHGHLQWTYPLQYGMRLRKVKNTVIIANNMDGINAIDGGYNLDYNGESELSGNTFIGNDGHKAGWRLPTGANKAGNIYFNNGSYEIQFAMAQSRGAVPNPNGNMVFANLPGQSGVLQPGPIEAQEFDIVDGAKTGGGAAVFDDQVQGGGSGHYKVRYNGSSWRRIG